MSDYDPLDISQFCNVGTDILRGAPGDPRFFSLLDDIEAPVGHQTFQGLPFIIGTEDGSREQSFIKFSSETSGVSIPVNKPANNIIFVHRLLESDLYVGGPLGKPIAEYVFHLENDSQIRVSIREKFEISSIMGFGGTPYLALPDQKNVLLDRHEGPWENMGRRQTEVTAGTASYVLWSWKNPHPEVTIKHIEIVPTGVAFILAGITLGNLDEHPFPRQPRKPVKLSLADPKAASKPFDLEVEVNRGTATYVHPLPEDSSNKFIDSDVKGWGEPQNDKSSPSYVEIQATPSATISIKRNNTELESFNWGDLESSGSVKTPKVHAELVDREKNWVHVQVLDEETGNPIPCRVHFRSPSGIPYQPHGHHNQVNSNLGSWHSDVGGDVRLGQITYAYIDGKCQGWLPRGQVIVDVARGFEYEPLRTAVEIKPGQRELTLSLKRWTNMNAQRWFSGDSHVHFLSTQGSHLESQGEDLNVVNLLQSQWGSLFTNTEDFTGRPSISDDGNNIVYVLQENRQHMLGHMILWGVKEPIMPWCSDGPSEDAIGGSIETNMSAWADECHKQGGTVILPHFPNPNGEPAALIATGRADGVEMIRLSKHGHSEYYRYLNCGYRLPLVGGTDKMGSDVPVGLYRTYTYIPDSEEFNYDSWTKNVTLGRTFLSSGPIISLTAEGQNIGDTIQLSGPGTIEVEANAQSTFPIHTLQIIQEGKVVAETEEKNGTRQLNLKAKIDISGHSWIAARCGAPHYQTPTSELLTEYHHDVWHRGLFAHTSPIYISCKGNWQMFNRETADYMLQLIEGGMSYIEETAARHTPGTVTHHHGEDDHLAFLHRPYIQARNLINQRIKNSGLA